jgi:hypothetical protein
MAMGERIDRPEPGRQHQTGQEHPIEQEHQTEPQHQTGQEHLTEQEHRTEREHRIGQEHQIEPEVGLLRRTDNRRQHQTDRQAFLLHLTGQAHRMEEVEVVQWEEEAVHLAEVEAEEDDKWLKSSDRIGQLLACKRSQRIQFSDLWSASKRKAFRKQTRKAGVKMI